MPFADPASADPILVKRDDTTEDFQPACISIQDRTSLTGRGKNSHIKLDPDAEADEIGNLIYADYPRGDISQPDNTIDNLLIEGLYLDGSRDAFETMESVRPDGNRADWGHGHNGVLAYGFHDQITLRDLWITDFHGYGVHFDAVQNGRVENVHVRRCGSTIDADGNSGESSRQGMHIATRGADVPDDTPTDGTDRLIAEPEDDSNLRYGNTGTIISGCTVSGATSSGIDFAGDHTTRFANAIVNCRLWNNSANVVVGGFAERVSGNVAAASDGSNFQIRGTRNIVSDNVSAYAGSDGFYISGDNVTISNCHSFRDSSRGFDIAGNNITAKNCTITESGSWPLRNRGEGNCFDGFLFIDCDDSVMIRSDDENKDESYSNITAYRSGELRINGERGVLKNFTHYDTEAWGTIRVSGDECVVETVYVSGGNDRVLRIEGDRCTVRDVRSDGSESDLIQVEGNDTRIYGGDATWENVAVDALRTTINDVGRNDGDPRTGEGQWADEGYEGVTVYDTEADDGTIYQYINGTWV